MKKFLSVTLAAVLLLLFAVQIPATSASEISPRYTHIYNASAVLEISASGLATITLNCSGDSSVTRIQCTYKLYKQNDDGSWTNITGGSGSWYYSISSSSMSFSRTRQLSTSGTYKVDAYFTATVGSAAENAGSSCTASY